MMNNTKYYLEVVEDKITTIIAFIIAFIIKAVGIITFSTVMAYIAHILYDII